MAIDVGPGANNGATAGSGDYTIICKGNPANATGTIDHIEIYDDEGSSTHNVASFENVAGDNFTARGRATNLVTGGAGLSEFDAPGDFTVFAITTGDYIGIFGDDIDRSSNSDLVWYKTADQTECVNTEFTPNYARLYALYATGVETGVGAIMNQFQGVNIGADLFNGTLL